MQISIISRGIELEGADREYARRRLGYALGRFSDRVSRITLTIGDTNGPRGGVDKFCRIAVNLRRGELLAVTTEATLIREAVDLASERIKRTVSRRIARLRSRRGVSGARQYLPRG